MKQLHVNVTINAVEPDGIAMPIWRRGKSTEYVNYSLDPGRLRPADHMVATILYLAGGASAVINGEEIERATTHPLDG